MNASIWPLVVELAGPPRGKGAGRAVSTARGARVFTDERTRSYESQLRYAAQQQMAGAPPTAQPLIVIIEARVPIPASFSRLKTLAARAGHIRPTTRPDCNNYSKTLDALNGVVWVDDKQIVEETVRKVYAAAPGLTIVIRPMAPPAVLSLAPERPGRTGRSIGQYRMSAGWRS